MEVNFGNKKFIDLHQHGLLSGDLNSLNKKRIILPNTTINNWEELTYFVKQNINPLLKKQAVIKILLQTNIENSIESGTILICPSIDYTLANNFVSINDFVFFLSEIKKNFKEDIFINYDLGISRNNFKTEDITIIKDLIVSNIFNGIDLYGNELLKIDNIGKIYKFAHKNNLILKAHIGEFCSAENVKNLYDELNLDEIQHGISVAQSLKVLNYFKEKNVVFNISPTSNFKLKKLNYQDNPIRFFYDNGIKVTISTDDRLFFGKSVKDEFEILLKNKIFTFDELEEINKFSLDYARNKYKLTI
ncbi:MAG: hypothetical protein LBD88_05200 [Candidatus Peribacteria bacterium]|jgi:adenosine deaminase|nr:hypothetical protein [Candidatus Peribacteria bacterium]